MNKKWILLLIPISLTIMVKSASGQSSQISNAVVGSDDPDSNNQTFLPDTTSAPVPADSAYANLETGWHKASGQMPVFIPRKLPNSMPTLTPPPVDEEMIFHVGSAVSDSLITPKQERK